MAADWLFQKEEHVPVKDNERFLDKSILAIIDMLGRIKRTGTFSNKAFYKLNGSLKVIFTLINILLLSLSRSFLFVSILDLCMVISLIILEKEDRKNILLISIIIPLFTFIMLIPSFLVGNKNNSILIIMKVVGTILSVNILSYTTKWDNITKTLKLLFIPDLFIWVMEITIKYIVILGEHSLNGLYALKLRSVGKNNKKYNSLSRIMGNLFLKSKDMGEEMFSAMECRGFTGEYSSIAKFKINKKDMMYCIANIIIFIIFILTK
ncbi:energy-coupling factor transporter transmembrane protein EcfT [Clostridium bovifaecis]|uniref:Energy-coupling factor transporter transmembrane protein EcfT n=1 Tax=Clostridium bovifaecis TaxID=2184719 RepID=A0A6I6ETV5_9CLOT|nr:energy-coupling factor transporter transmembrane protein EcfT [Clostridium bovifaecis]